MQIYDHDQSTYHMGIYKSKQAESMKRTMLHKEGKKRHAPFTLAQLHGRQQEKSIENLLKNNSSINTLRNKMGSFERIGLV